MAVLKDLTVLGSSRWLSDSFGTNITANAFIKTGGTASQFLKADGSVDSNTYATTGSLGSYLPLTGGTLAKAAGTSGNILNINNTTASSNVWIYYKVAGANKAAIGYYTNFAFISNEASSGKARIGVADDGTPQYWPAYNSAAANRYTLWHANNSNLATVSWSALNLSAAGTLSVGTTSTFTGAVTCSNNLSVASGLVTARDLTVTRNLVIPKTAPVSAASGNYYLYVNPSGSYSE